MKILKISGIVLMFLLVLTVIILMIRKSRTGKDIVTGVSNDKIKKAAESAGIPTPIAEKIAEAPDSNAAARSIGVPVVLATAIANGVETGDRTSMLSLTRSDTPLPLGVRKWVWNDRGKCPYGYQAASGADAGWCFKDSTS